MSLHARPHAERLARNQTHEHARVFERRQLFTAVMNELRVGLFVLTRQRDP